MARSVYIHIPFCKSKCKYCSFVSLGGKWSNLDCDYSTYVDVLVKDIKVNYRGEVLQTLYFGGGTPSLLPFSDIEKIKNCFNLADNCEITLEANPDDITEYFLNGLKQIGITRLSLGAQTFDNKILQNIGRRHLASDTIKAVKLAQKVGFQNISLDLIYGLPNQTMNVLKNDIQNLLELKVQHISTYGLEIDKNSFFYTHKPENIADDDTQADMYNYICDELEKNGFTHYEISNFAKEGFESNHNLTYWNNEEYYGFGVAAHGYVDDIRYSKAETLPEYIKNPSDYKTEHFVSKKEMLEEELFLGFRRTSGIDTALIFQKYGINFEEKYSEVIKKFTPDYLAKTDNGYKLTRNGVLISNLILSEFIEE